MKNKYLNIFLISMAIIMCIINFHLNLLTLFIIFTTIPIYIISKKSPSIGLLTYIILFLSILLDDYYYSILFLFFYGIVGVFLGMLSHYLDKKFLISLINGVILFISINAINMTLTLTTLSNPYINTSFLQLIILLFSIFFSYIMLLICNYIYGKLFKTKYSI